MKKTILAILILTLFFSVPAYADVVWPALYLVSRMVSWWAILTGLIIEYLFVRKLTNFSVSKSIIANVCMNTASTILGMILIPIAGIGLEFFPGMIIYKIFHIGTLNPFTNPFTWTATLFFAAFINAFIENFVLNKFFKCKLGWRGFWWLSLANGLSVACVFASLLIFPPDR